MRQKKHKLLFCLLTCTFFISSAQEPIVKPSGKNEAGILLIGVRQNYGLAFSSDFYVAFFNGIDYKRHFGLNAIRLGMEYRNARDEGFGDFVGTSHYQENKFSIGYEHSFLKKSIRPFLGVDLIYLHSKFQEEFNGGFWDAYFKQDLTENGFGFAPLLGINFLLFRAFSLSFEADFEILNINRKGTGIKNEIDDPAARHMYPIQNNEHINLLNPLRSMALNYIF
ncbi:MAG: hypothetical protein ABJB16_17145 [Saprospiraceae bacterium]